MDIHELKVIYENLLHPIFGEKIRIDDGDEDKNWVVIILDGTQEDFILPSSIKENLKFGK